MILSVQVLRECHFAVPAGKLHMLLGANGCALPFASQQVLQQP